MRVRPPLRDEVLTQLAELLRNPARQVREEALDRYRRLATTRSCAAAKQRIVEIYKLEENSTAASDDTNTALQVATALVALGAQEHAWPIVQRLEQELQPHNASVNPLRRLRFEGWPDQAADYLRQLLTDKQSNIAIGGTLSGTTLGLFSADLAQRVLGYERFHVVLEELKQQLPDHSAQLNWIMALNAPALPMAAVAQLLTADTSERVRRLAATALLTTEQHAAACATLRDLTATNTSEAALCGRSLLDANAALDMDWQLLYDMALVPGQQGEAIATLLLAGETHIGLPAAIHLLAAAEPTTNRDQQQLRVVAALLPIAAEMGMAAAAWLAIRPGYRERLAACDLLLEYGQVEQAVLLLHLLARESFDESRTEACRRLLTHGEAERVAPLLAPLVYGANADLRYQAHLALALAGTPLDMSRHATNISDPAPLIRERTELYETTLSAFSQAAQALLQQLDPQDKFVASAVLLAQQSLETLFHGLAPWAHYAAAERSPRLAILATQARAALLVGDLVLTRQRIQQALGTSNLSAAARDAVLELTNRAPGIWAVHQAIAYLEHQNAHVRQAAARALGRLGDASALRSLLTALADPDKSVRSAAAEALGQLGDTKALPDLISALADPEEDVRQTAAEALGQLGDTKALPDLISALADPEEDVRQAAAEALGQLGDIAALPPLTTALADPDEDMRRAAVWALEELDNTETLPQLIAALADPKENVRQAAAYALGRLGDVTALPPLIAALADPKEDVRQAAAYALGRLGDVTALPLLIAALVDSEENMCWAAARALGELGDAALPALITALATPNENVRWAAAQALGQLGNMTALPPLIAVLADPDKIVCSIAARALGQLGNTTALPHLLTALTDPDLNVRQAAACALGQLGDTTALPHLLIALASPNWDARWTAALALGQLGNTTALPDLLTALDDPDLNVRWAAARALGQLGDAAVLPYLISALVASDSTMRETAAEALGRLRVGPIDLLLATYEGVSRYTPQHHLQALVLLDARQARPILERMARRPQYPAWVDQLYAEALRRLGDYAAACGAAERALGHLDKRDVERATAHAICIACYRELGQHEQATNHLERAQVLLIKEKEYKRACFAAICGDHEAALELLEAALQKRQVSQAFARCEPDFDSIRHLPAFQALVGLPGKE